MGAYDTIDLRPSWGAASLAVFSFLVLFLSFVAVAVKIYRGFHFWSVVIWLTLPPVALLGFSAAALGLWRESRRVAAVVGLVLNGTVLLSCLVALVWS